MSTPTDPYSSSSRRPFEDDEILAPLPPEPTAPSAAEATRSPGGFSSPLTEPLPSPQAFVSTQGMDPAFDQHPRQAEAPDADAPQTSSASLAEAIGIPSSSSEQSAAGTQDRNLVNSQDRNAPETASSTRADAPKKRGTRNKISDYSEIDYSFGSDNIPGEGPAATANQQDPDAFLDSLPERPPRTTAGPATTPTGETFPPTSSVTGINSWGEDAAEDHVPAAPRGRGWTHAGVLVATLLLVPVAWYLLSDASARLFLVPNNPWETGDLNYAALGELAGGIAVVALIWLLARMSSLGAHVVGAIVAIFGLLPLVLPTFTQDSILAPLDRAIGDFNALTGNIIHHLNLDLGSGRMFTFGAILLLTGVVSHSARRRGERHGSVTARRAIVLSTMDDK